jgi:disulfide bond formation protein DsbB
MEQQSAFVLSLNHNLSLLTLVGGIVLCMLVAFSLYSFVTKKHIALLKKLPYFPLFFVISFAGLILSLMYSEVFHYAPCDLCWFQRIFLYPQVFMILFAWYTKDVRVFTYTALLSCIGIAIASYHHLLQLGYDLLKPCSSAPFAVDCAKPSFVEFGFVTFPLMAVVLFGYLLLISSIHIVTHKK